MREIFAPLDGTKAADTALSWVAYAARRASARVRLFSVIPLESEHDRDVSEREAYLEGHRRALEAQGIHVDAELARGDPARRITTRARDADLTVMTSGTVRWVVSAVLDRVLQDIEGPLVVVRTTPGEQKVPPEPKKILVPLDSASYPSQVLPVVTDLAASLGSSVVLCHVVPALGGYQASEDAPPGIARAMGEWLNEPNEFVSSAAADLRAAGLEVETVTAAGEPAQRIRRLAESCGAGLIAMTTRGRDSLGRRVTGSVSNQVLESTAIPCLLLRRKSDAIAASPEAGNRVTV